jgi:hypothetical protein
MGVHPTRDYKRHRRPKWRPKSKGRRLHSWIVLELGLGDPLPSVVERVITRAGATVAGSGSSPTYSYALSNGPQPKRVTRAMRQAHYRSRCWWRIHATYEQAKAIRGSLRELGLNVPRW